MRCLLTGASGFLGSNFLKVLLAETDWTVACPVSFSHRGVPDRILEAAAGRNDSLQRIDVITCDLAAPIADTTASRFGDVDYVINFASESHIPRSISDPVPFVQNNMNLMLHLLDWARTRQIKGFFHISTDEVYGPIAEGAHAEWDPTLPSTPYSASKAAQEALGIAFWRTFNVPLVLVNTMNPVGRMQDPEKFVPTVIRKVLQRETVEVHADPDGTIGSRVYVHAQDLADAVLFLVNLKRPTSYGLAATRPDRWNVVGARDVDNLELAQLIAKALNTELLYELKPANRPGHGLRYALDGSKLAEAGWTPRRSIEEAVEELVGWTRNHPLWANRQPRP